MFSKIHFKGLRASRLFGYAADVPFFKGRRSLEFKPGLNILFGPNGCGKSTVLNILSQTMCAKQGGISAITETAIRETVEFGLSRKPAADLVGLKVEHDGQPIVFADPRKVVGLRGGTFDDDFIRQGLVELTSRQELSHGQAALSRMNGVLGVVQGSAKVPEKPQQTMYKHQVNDLWCSAIDLVQARMEASISLGQVSVLLDEPESNFSLLWASRLWELLSSPEVRGRVQLIVATHSPFALNIPGAHYIDFEPGYREQVLQAMTSSFGTQSAA